MVLGTAWPLVADVILMAVEPGAQRSGEAEERSSVEPTVLIGEGGQAVADGEDLTGGEGGARIQ